MTGRENVGFLGYHSGTPIRRGSAGWVRSRAHLSIASWWEDQIGSEGLRSGGAIQCGAVYAARGFAAPAGAKGLLVVSMYQIASASRRARSTRATLAPRCLPRRARVRW
jgi:hypothetical protein